MGAYIIEVLIFQSLFLAMYYLVFKNEQFFNANRIYLIATPLIAVLLPVVKIKFFTTILPEQITRITLPEIVLGSSNTTSDAVTIAQETVTSGTFSNLWLVYTLGVAIATGVFVYKYAQLQRFLRLRRDQDVVTIPNSTAAFTFLNIICIGDGIDTLSRKHILNHERIHVQQKHTWDLLYFEAWRILFWFNPLIYLYQREVNLVHEYIADAKVAATSSRKAYYQELLNTAFGTQQFSFINTFFNHSFIKKRIIMLQKSKSNQRNMFKYALILPLLLGMVMYASCSQAEPESVNSDLDNLYENLQADLESGEITQEELNSFISKLKNQNSLKVPQIIEVVEQKEYQDGDDVPFSVIDKVPLYPGCDENMTNKERKDCMSKKVNGHVMKNFNTKQALGLGLTGITKIYVSFRINKEGIVDNVRARAPHPDLEAEAMRVVSGLPKMKSGQQRGQEVGVLYSLPITFKIEE